MKRGYIIAMNARSSQRSEIDGLNVCEWLRTFPEVQSADFVDGPTAFDLIVVLEARDNRQMERVRQKLESHRTGPNSWSSSYMVTSARLLIAKKPTESVNVK